MSVLVRACVCFACLPVVYLCAQPHWHPYCSVNHAHSRRTGYAQRTLLATGAAYTLFRWDSVEAFGDYTRVLKAVNFTATAAGTWDYADPLPFWSNGTTYYRVHAVNAAW